jgi:hypothetical protein
VLVAASFPKTIQSVCSIFKAQVRVHQVRSKLSEALPVALPILGVVNSGLTVVASTVQVQDRVYSEATQVLAAKPAIVLAVPVCQAVVQTRPLKSG